MNCCQMGVEEREKLECSGWMEVMVTVFENVVITI